MKKCNILMLSFGFFAIMMTGLVIADNVPWDRNDPESIKLEERAKAGMLTDEDYSNLQKEYDRKKKYSNLFDNEKMRMKKEAHEKYLKEQAERLSQPETPLTQPKLGIVEQDIPPFVNKGIFDHRQGNRWIGYVDGVFTSVYSGAKYGKPNQGMIVFLVGNDAKILTPLTQTGPLRITAEEGGVLTLVSVAGKYEVYDKTTETRSTVVTPGGVMYHINLRTGMFQ